MILQLRINFHKIINFTNDLFDFSITIVKYLSTYIHIQKLKNVDSFQLTRD